jgi:hypothetical protein
MKATADRNEVAAIPKGFRRLAPGFNLGSRGTKNASCPEGTMPFFCQQRPCRSGGAADVHSTKTNTAGAQPGSLGLPSKNIPLACEICRLDCQFLLLDSRYSWTAPPTAGINSSWRAHQIDLEYRLYDLCCKEVNDEYFLP